MDEEPLRRWPLTGRVSFEFVDGGDPNNADAPPSFGHFGVISEPSSWANDRRFPALFRWLADSIELDQIPSETYVFSERWSDLRGDSDAQGQRERLERELAREVGPEHALFGVSARAAASCHHCDDVIFETGDGYAVVHLTWTKNPPDRPPAPGTTIHPTWVTVARYVREHEDE